MKKAYCMKQYLHVFSIFTTKISLCYMKSWLLEVIVKLCSPITQLLSVGYNTALFVILQTQLSWQCNSLVRSNNTQTNTGFLFSWLNVVSIEQINRQIFNLPTKNNEITLIYFLLLAHIFLIKMHVLRFDLRLFYFIYDTYELW